MAFAYKKILLLTLAVCVAFPVVFTVIFNATNHDHTHESLHIRSSFQERFNERVHQNKNQQEHEHDCVGYECITCLKIELANNFLKLLKMAIFGVFLAVVLSRFLQNTINELKHTGFIPSPVLLKVRLNF